MNALAGPICILVLAASTGLCGLGMRRLVGKTDFQDTQLQAEEEARGFKLLWYTTPVLIMSAAAVVIFY